MKYTIKAPRQLNASINLPASKSISNRALVINAMAGCKLQPRNLSDCDDTEVIIAALRDMPDVINIKDAGTIFLLHRASIPLQAQSACRTALLLSW